MRHLTLLSVLSLLLAACGKEPQSPPNPGGSQPAGTAPAGHPQPHTERTALGEVKVGEHTIAVFQVAKIEPGKEGDFDLDFPAGKPLPGTLRGWIGIESGVGSRKVRFEKETATRMHGHPEVPKPMLEGSRFWLEVEGPAGTARASVAFRP